MAVHSGKDAHEQPDLQEVARTPAGVCLTYSAPTGRQEHSSDQRDLPSCVGLGGSKGAGG